MSSAPAPSRIVILAAVDDTATSDDALRMSATLAQTLPGAELHLVHVVKLVTDVDSCGAVLTSLEELLKSARLLMDRYGEHAAKSFSGRIVRHLAAGTAWREILQLAANVHADLIVVGSHGRKGVERWMLGSVSEKVVRKASCAVLVARPKDYHASGVPEVEPPCVDCLAVQKQTGGDSLWCSRHDRSSKHLHAHTHYVMPQPFAMGSQLIRPE